MLSLASLAAIALSRPSAFLRRENEMARRRTFGHVRRLPSGRWQASYLNPATATRVHALSTFERKADAGLWLASIEADLARGEHVGFELAQRGFSEWAQDWVSGLQVKPKTLAGYTSCLRNHVLPNFGHLAVANITYRDCKRFVDEMLAAGHAPGTVGEARKVLRLVLREALRSDAIRRNPADGVRVARGRRQEMVFLSAEEVLRLADEIAHPPRPAWDRAKAWPAYGLLVRVTAWTGLRAGEVGALRVGRVHLMDPTIEVSESVAEIAGELVYGPPKTYARRRIPLPTDLAAELAEQCAARPQDPTAFVFSAPGGGPLRHGNFFNRFFKPAVARSDLDPRTRFHDLRHTAAALMIAEGAHLLAVKQRLGHSTIQVTADLYGHLFPSLEAALTDRLNEAYRAAVSANVRPLSRVDRATGGEEGTSRESAAAGSQG
jgi:integrase